MGEFNFRDFVKHYRLTRAAQLDEGPSLLMEAATTSGSPPLDGKSKKNASNWVHQKVDKFTKGMFNDQYWKPVQTIWKEFDRLGLNWTPLGAEYEHEKMLVNGKAQMVPVRKRWSFEIAFINNRDNMDKLYGQITAAGAGPPADPLDRYDLTITVS